MDERSALLRAVCANPEEDTPRLVFADFLDEHAAGGREGRDDRERAAYIRLSVELDAIEVTDLACARTGDTLLRPWDGQYEVRPWPRCRCAVCRPVRERDRLAARGRLYWESEATGDISHRISEALHRSGRRSSRPQVTVEYLQAKVAETEMWPAVTLHRGFAGTLHMSGATFPRYAGELFARGPFTTVRLRGLRTVPLGTSGRVALENVPDALRPWLPEQEWVNPGEAQFAVSQACLAFGRAERDRFWAAERAAA